MHSKLSLCNTQSERQLVLDQVISGLLVRSQQPLQTVEILSRGVVLGAAGGKPRAFQLLLSQSTRSHIKPSLSLPFCFCLSLFYTICTVCFITFSGLFTLGAGCMSSPAVRHMLSVCTGRVFPVIEILGPEVPQSVFEMEKRFSV